MQEESPTMITLTVDDRTIEAQDGSSVLSAV